MTAGALGAGRLVQRVGHIRTFAASVSLLIRALYAVSPLGIIGASTTGIVLGLFGRAPVYARASGLTISETAWFMTAVILGGVALQWPLGRLSDRLDQRTVIVVTMAGAAVAFAFRYAWRTSTTT